MHKAVPNSIGELPTVLVLGLLLACVVLLSSAHDPDPVRYKSVPYVGFQLWSVAPQSQHQRLSLQNIQEDYDLDVWSTSAVSNAMDVLVAPQFRTELMLRFIREKIPYRVIIEDLQDVIDNENPSTTKNFQNRFGHNMDWDSYHRIDDINGYLKYLADTYPQTVELINIGNSTEDRPLNIIRVSSSLQSTKRPAIWIDGGIHAREWISPAVTTYIIHQLVELPDHVEMFRDVDWYIMPVMNPDGYEYSHAVDRFWRKTRSTSPKSTCVGADPNRNFNFKWNGKGTSKRPCDPTYPGRRAFSEPEIRAVSKLLLDKADQFKMYLTFHSYGQYWLIPYSYEADSYPSDYEDLKQLAKRAAVKCQKYKYTVGSPSELLYPASGNSMDWAKGVAAIKYTYTIELPDNGRYGFVLPFSYIKTVSEDIFPAIEVLAEHVASTCATESLNEV